MFCEILNSRSLITPSGKAYVIPSIPAHINRRNKWLTKKILNTEIISEKYPKAIEAGTCSSPKSCTMITAYLKSWEGIANKNASEIPEIITSGSQLFFCRCSIQLKSCCFLSGGRCCSIARLTELLRF